MLCSTSVVTVIVIPIVSPVSRIKIRSILVWSDTHGLAVTCDKKGTTTGYERVSYCHETGEGSKPRANSNDVFSAVGYL